MATDTATTTPTTAVDMIKRRRIGTLLLLTYPRGRCPSDSHAFSRALAGFSRRDMRWPTYKLQNERDVKARNYLAGGAGTAGRVSLPGFTWTPRILRAIDTIR